ncbi:uncharacterized protein TRIADDRAFT_53203 [Trichoplax adhaerens]|uniref:DUF4378 domain-containing protein n=1 Tax=Trichoplax adhaerens TaxID=10228 RepID=B3RNL0_TRIAD|nr:hypothetical protein TRIADDRAFT_53203 [Trichoplax adhaerens]EDV27474.1 hypothetical protein TRIADDRAFT_53203 [Trichoplax adhaerens]|eukprot:XP_002109308.1 hypothetical protein TRIADDRAFT_53203 [Trichoplax adhaerens]
MATAIHWRKDDQFKQTINANENPMKVVIQRVPSYTLNEVNTSKRQKLNSDYKVTADEANRAKVRFADSHKPTTDSSLTKNAEDGNQTSTQECKNIEDRMADISSSRTMKAGSKIMNEIESMTKARSKATHGSDRKALENDEINDWKTKGHAVNNAGRKISPAFNVETCSISKRKIATAPAPPNYKGFNLFEEYTTTIKEKEPVIVKRISQRVRNNVGNQMNLRFNKPTTTTTQNNKKPVIISKGKKTIRKIQRYAEKEVNLKYKPPVTQITPYSWREGKEAIRNAFKETKSSQPTSKSPPPQQDYSRTSSSASSSSTYSAMRASTPTSSKGVSDANYKSDLEKNEEDQSSSKEKEDSIYNDRFEDTSPTESDDDNTEYRGIADQILRELKEDTTNNQQSINKSSKNTARKRKAALTKTQEHAKPLPKQRHYDQKEVQEYQKKKNNLRNKQRLEQRKKEKLHNDEKRRRLQDLYNQQKALLAANLRQSRKKVTKFHIVQQGTFTSSTAEQDYRFINNVQNTDINPRKKIFNIESDIPNVWQPPISTLHNYEEQVESSNGENQITDSASSTITNTIEGKSNQFKDNTSMNGSSSGGSRYHNGENEIISQQHHDSVITENQSTKVRRIESIKAAAILLKDRIEAETRKFMALQAAKKSQQISPSIPQNYAIQLSQDSTEDKDVTLSTFHRDIDQERELPGIQNLKLLAKHNHEEIIQNRAASIIQAYYRGHQVRNTIKKGNLLPVALKLQVIEDQVNDQSLDSQYAKSNKLQTSNIHQEFTANDQNADELYNVTSSDNINQSYVNGKPSVSIQTTSRFDELYKKAIDALEASKAAIGPLDLDDEEQCDDRKSFEGSNSDSVSNEKLGEPENLQSPWRKSLPSAFPNNYGYTDNVQLNSYSVSTVSLMIRNSNRRYKENFRNNRDHDVQPLSGIAKGSSSLQDLDYENDFEELSKSQISDRTDQYSTSFEEPSADKITAADVLSESISQRDSVNDSNIARGDSNNDYDVASRISLDSAKETVQAPSRSANNLVSPNAQPPKLLESEIFSNSNTTEDDNAVKEPHHKLSDNSQAKTFLDNVTQTDRPIKHELSEKRLSPADLERRLHAELQYLESIDESVRQLSQVEKARAISFAQQETVSLAQILKARQYEHMQEMDKYKSAAERDNLEVQKRFDEAKDVLKSASELTSQKLAEIKSEASESVRSAAQRLKEVESAISQTAINFTQQLQSAHSATVAKLADTVADHIVNAKSLAIETASNAATATIQSVLNKDVRDLRKDGGDSYKISETSSNDTVSYGSYSSKFSSPISNKQSEVAEASKASNSSFSKSNVENSVVSEHLSNDSGQNRSSKTSITDSSASFAKELSVTASSEKDISENIDVRSSGSHDYTSRFEDLSSSSTIQETADADKSFHEVLPSVSHRRRYSSENGQSNIDISDTASISYSSQYMKEEMVRAKHQAALLNLREKVVQEKTEAEIAWLEHLKKKFRSKGEDDKMPMLRKRQRSLLLHLQAEQAEIKRLKAANRAAQEERKLIMYQQKEIDRIRKTTQAYRGKLSKHKSKDDKNASVLDQKLTGSDISAEDEVMDSRLPAGLSTSPDVVSVASKSDDSTPTETTVMKKLKNMQKHFSERFLTPREQKLQRRRKEADALLDKQKRLLTWKNDLDEEQGAINLTLDKVAELGTSQLIESTSKGAKIGTAKKFSTDEFNDHDSSNLAEHDAIKNTTKQSPNISLNDEYNHITSSSNDSVEVTPSQSKLDSSDLGDSYTRSQNSDSIAEEISNESKSISTTNEGTQENDEMFGDLHSINSLASVPLENESSQKEINSGKASNSIPSEYANSTFESSEPSTLHTASASSQAIQESLDEISASKKFSDKQYSSAALANKSANSYSSYSNTFVSSEDEASANESQTTTETASDLSDIEGRIRKLATELQLRRQIAKDLIKEKKKLEKDRLRKQEEQLRAELNKVETFISKVKSEISDKSQEFAHSSVVKPPTNAALEQKLVNLNKSLSERKKASKVISNVSVPIQTQLQSSEENSYSSIQSHNNMSKKSGNENTGSSTQKSVSPLPIEDNLEASLSDVDIESNLIINAKSNDSEDKHVVAEMPRNDQPQDNELEKALSEVGNSDITRSSSGTVTPHSDVNSSVPSSIDDIQHDMIIIERHTEDDSSGKMSKTSARKSQDNISVSSSRTVTPVFDDNKDEEHDYVDYSDDWDGSTENATQQRGDDKDLSILEDEDISKASSNKNVVKPSVDEILEDVSDRFIADSADTSVEEDIKSQASNIDVSSASTISANSPIGGNIELNDPQDSFASNTYSSSKASTNLKSNRSTSRVESILNDAQGAENEKSNEISPKPDADDWHEPPIDSEKLDTSISEDISESIEDDTSNKSSVSIEKETLRYGEDFPADETPANVMHTTSDVVGSLSDKSIDSDVKQERSESALSRSAASDEENSLESNRNVDPMISRTPDHSSHDEIDTEMGDLSNKDYLSDSNKDKELVDPSQDLANKEAEYSDTNYLSDAFSGISSSDIGEKDDQTIATTSRESYQWNSLETVTTNMTVNLLDDALLAVFKVRLSKESRTKAQESASHDQEVMSAEKPNVLPFQSQTAAIEDLKGDDTPSLLNLSELPEPSVPRSKLNDLKNFDMEVDELYHDFENNSQNYQDFIHEVLPEDEPTVTPETNQEVIQYFVPHTEEYIKEIVSTATDQIISHHNLNGADVEIKCPENFNYNETDIKADTEFEKSSLRSYHVMIFDLVKEILDEYYDYNKNANVNLPLWMKPKRLRLPARLRGTPLNASNKTIKEHTIGYVVELLKLKTGKGSVSKKNLKKDLVDSILAQELAEEEPDWIDYDKDETCVKMQVADSILSSLLEETSSIFKNTKCMTDVYE